MVNASLELVYDTFVHYGPDREHRPDPHHRNLGVKYEDIKLENGAASSRHSTRWLQKKLPTLTIQDMAEYGTAPVFPCAYAEW